MDTLLARYFDGDLDDTEAREFLDAVESNPEFERELQTYERMLVVGKKLPTPQVPAGFTERVMAQVTGRTGRERGRTWLAPLWMRWAVPTAAAVAVTVAFVTGWWLARDISVTPFEPAVGHDPIAVTTDVSPVRVNQAAVAGTDVRYVRLVYVPADSSVDRVTVAGDFNGWDPESTPMRRQGGAWTTILVLPVGNYEYMFVEDGRRWVTDPLAMETRDDGFGGVNAVLDVEL